MIKINRNEIRSKLAKIYRVDVDDIEFDSSEIQIHIPGRLTLSCCKVGFGGNCGARELHSMNLDSMVNILSMK